MCTWWSCKVWLLLSAPLLARGTSKYSLKSQKITRGSNLDSQNWFKFRSKGFLKVRNEFPASKICNRKKKLVKIRQLVTEIENDVHDVMTQWRHDVTWRHWAKIIRLYCGDIICKSMIWFKVFNACINSLDILMTQKRHDVITSSEK